MVAVVLADMGSNPARFQFLPGFILSQSVTYFISFSGHYALFSKICLIQKHLLLFFHECQPPCTQYWFLVRVYVYSLTVAKQAK